MNKSIVLLALLLAAPAFAQQVPAPINAPTSVTSGHALCATGNRQQAADCGAAPGTVTGVTASSPLFSSGGATPNISIATPLSVGVGGTGNSTATAHSLPVNEGGSAQANTGTLGTGQLLIGQGASADPAPKTISGDCSVASSGAVTCTATGGVSFGGLATLGGSAQGQIAYWNGSAWSLLSPGTSGQPLQAKGAGANPQFGSMRQILASRSSVSIAGNVTDYLVASGQGTASGTETAQTQIMPIGGTFKNLTVQTSSSPGTANTYTITLRIAGAAPGSGPACTISGAATTCSDTTDTATITPGQTFDYQIVTSASAGSASFQVSAEFDNP